MIIYVNSKAGRDGNGTKEMPFRRMNDAAKVAQPGDEVLVAPGIYREYVDPINAGTEDARITYRSEEPLGAVITGAEQLKGWKVYQGNVWTARVKNSVFGGYNPYKTLVYGDWYFAKADKHTGCVYLNDRAMYETTSLEDCIKGEVYECSWVPEESIYKWYTEQDEEKDETVLYANFQGKNPNAENVEINVRRECFLPSKTGVGYITVSGFRINKAATTWAPPAAYQDGMIGPHWSKGWIIEDCEISDSKCAGISLGKYLDPDNDHYFTYRQVKSPTQMERDAVCRGQYHGWLKEKVGSHIIRRNNIHHCEQGGIIGRMGGVFSIIEDNHIHHINNMMELGGAEIAGIKMHAAIDVIMRRNHIHHCTMGIWCDWEAQGTRLTQNLLHDNQRPPYAKSLKGGMMSQDIFVEVGHGPTLIDNNILLSDVSLRFATQGVALVHNLICGAFTCVGGGTGWRYTPYHIPHRTEVMGFMTILHGDDRFYNNIFVQKWPVQDVTILHDSDEGSDQENRLAGTWMFEDYPTYDAWIAQFDFTKPADMGKCEPAHFGHLPVWSEGNVYLGGAKASRHEKNGWIIEGCKDTASEAQSENGEKTEAETHCGNGGEIISEAQCEDDGETCSDNLRVDAVCDNIRVELVERDGKLYLDTNIYEMMEQASRKTFADGQNDVLSETADAMTHEDDRSQAPTEKVCASCNMAPSGVSGRMIHTELLGKAFEPEQKYENPDGTPITFDSDYFGEHRGLEVLPGPFANAGDSYCLSR